MKDKLKTWEEAVLWLRSQPDKKELVLSCYYDDPLITSANRFYESTEWKEIQKTLKNLSGAVLDIGAGRGISSYALARDGFDVYAIDPDPSSIVGVRAIKNLSTDSKLSISTIQSFAEAIPFKNSSFDIVYGRQVLHHAQNLNTMCKEISRVLKPNGFFIATREHVITKPDDLKKFFALHPLHKMYGGENAFLLNQYTDAIQKNGIKLLKVLNNYDSDINLFPESRDSLMVKSIRYHFPFYSLLMHLKLKKRGFFDNTPGRLFTFIGRKKLE